FDSFGLCRLHGISLSTPLMCPSTVSEQLDSMFVIFFYVLFPLPLLIARRHSEEASALKDLSFFLMTTIAISAFALPIVLARSPDLIISGGAAALVEFANLVVFATIIRFLWVDDYNRC
ncbi:Leptin receptor overlapping transcript-like 1, partial [Caligus rogercresseyi]